MVLSVNGNAQYPGQVPTLFELEGPVVGYHETGSVYQQWEVVPVDGDSVTLWNVGAQAYASAPQEVQCAPVVGSPVSFSWKFIQVSSDLCQIATTNGKYVWRLTGPEDYAPIVLQETPYTGKDSEWECGGNSYNPAT